MKNIRKIIGGIIEIFLIILFSYLVLEFIMIIFEPLTSTGILMYDKDIGFKVRPHLNGSNKFGFNDRDYPLTKDKYTYRILILSDSFNWVGGLNGNYTAVLEKKFDKYYNKHKIDIINAGYPMTHTGEELIVLEKYGLKYNPDLVILGFFLGNDFIDAEKDMKRIVVNDVSFLINKKKEITFLGYPVIFKSRLFYFIKQKLMINKELIKSGKKSLIKKDKKILDYYNSFDEDTYLYFEKTRVDFCNKQFHMQHIYDEKIQYIFNSILKMKKLLESKNIDFLVGIYPDEFQVNDKLLNQVYQKYNLDKNLCDVEYPEKILKDYLEKINVNYFSLLNDIKKESSLSNEPFYYPRNTHWGLYGNEAVAEIFFNYLINNSYYYNKFNKTD